jgi:hypothetical protein
MREQLLAVALAATLVLAGCSGAVSPTASPSAADDATPTAGTQAMTSNSGTVNFYVSDETNAISDFESLNVTVEAISFKRADAGDDESEVETEDERETEDPEADDENATATPEPTATPESEEVNETAEPTETPDSEADSEEIEDEEESDEEESDDWVVRDVNSTTVDLTELQGENATQLKRANVPNGTYTQVRLHISEVDGTLKDGSQVNVKLPSSRLKLNSEFTVGNGEEVDFVYDATVFEAGNSGKYILKPVASESGTDVPIKSVDRDDEGEGDIGARFVGQVERGQAATVKVTSQGGPVSGATVEVGDTEYQTGSDGTVMFDVPSDAEELEVEVEYDDGEAELKRTFATDGDDEVESDDAEEREESETAEPTETEEPTETPETDDDADDSRQDRGNGGNPNDDDTATPTSTEA